MENIEHPVTNKPKPMKMADAFEKRLGFRPSPPTLWRWRRHGVNGVKLKGTRCGRVWMATFDQVDEFIRLQSVEDDEPCEQADYDEATIIRLKAAGLM